MDRMDVDLPSEFLQLTSEMAQKNDDTLALVLLSLANSISHGSPTLNLAEIRRLNMVDLRPLLASQQYVKVAHIVLQRLSASELIPFAKCT
jgi:hypothetical protein